MITIEKPFKVLYKTAHDEHIVEEFDNAADALDHGWSYYIHLSEEDRKTVTIMVAKVTEAYDECGDIDPIIWNSDEQTVPDELLAQYMLERGLMPWEEDDIEIALLKFGKGFDGKAIRRVRNAMEGMLEGDAYTRAVEHAREMAQESAGALYDEGWRASDRDDEFAREYGLTQMEINAMIKALEDVERETEDMWNDDDLEDIANGITDYCTSYGWSGMEVELEDTRRERGLTERQLKTVREMLEATKEDIEGDEE